MAIAVSVKVPILRTFHEKIYDRCSPWHLSMSISDVLHALIGSPQAISHSAICYGLEQQHTKTTHIQTCSAEMSLRKCAFQDVEHGLWPGRLRGSHEALSYGDRCLFAAQAWISEGLPQSPSDKRKCKRKCLKAYCYCTSSALGRFSPTLRESAVICRQAEMYRLLYAGDSRHHSSDGGWHGRLHREGGADCPGL